MSQVEEQSYTQLQFRNAMRDRQNFRNLTVYGADADGTHFYYENAVGDRRFGLISDLTSFKIVAAGSATLTIPAGSLSGSGVTVYTGPPTATGVFPSYRSSSGGISGEVPIIKVLLIGQTVQLVPFRTHSFVIPATDLIVPFNIIDPVSGGQEWDAVTSLTETFGSQMTITANYAIIV